MSMFLRRAASALGARVRANGPLLVLLVALGTSAGCEKTTGIPREAPALGSENLVMGNPSGATTDEGQPGNYLLLRKQYALSYNNSKGTPNWVSWHLSKKWLGRTPRRDAFAPDPFLPAGFFAVRPNDYRGSGFDRGHLCPAADRGVSRQDMDVTFYMTNMVPQSSQLNRVTWEKLESYCRDQARDGEELYIVAGPAGQGGTGSKGPKDFLPASGGKIVVPSSCWKVVLILPPGVTDPQKVTAEEARAFAAIMPNNQALETAWRKYATTPAEVEKLTGYAFFSNLSADVAKELKGRRDTRARPTSTEPAPKERKKGAAKKGGEGGTLPGFEEGCVIGNRNTKIFHVPSEAYYEKAKGSKYAVFFKDADAARKAGYRQAKK
jgi:endonuclease G